MIYAKSRKAYLILIINILFQHFLSFIFLMLKFSFMQMLEDGISKDWTLFFQWLILTSHSECSFYIRLVSELFIYTILL